MDTVNTNKVLREVVTFQANQMKINLGAKVLRKTYRAEWQNGRPKNISIKSIRANHTASGQLVNSIKPVYVQGKYFVEMADYGNYINDGRKPGKGIPVDQMDKWIGQKRLKPRNTKSGEFLKNTKNNRKAMAFCMNRKIKFFGIEAYPFIDMSVDITEDRFANKLKEAIEQDVADNLNKIL